MRLALSLALWVAACGTALPSRVYAPSEVSELGSLPADSIGGEQLTARCTRAELSGAFDDERFANVDCSFERLSRVLRARAGELGSPFLVEKRCSAEGAERARLECSATAARPRGDAPTPPPRGALPAPSPAQVLDLDDPRPQDAERIRVSFSPARAKQPTAEPARGARRLPARSYDRVAETTQPAVGRDELGQLSASCRGACDSSSLRHALRVTAGQLGAGEVAAVRCFEDDGAPRCVALALEPWSS